MLRRKKFKERRTDVSKLMGYADSVYANPPKGFRVTAHILSVKRAAEPEVVTYQHAFSAYRQGTPTGAVRHELVVRFTTFE